uniref:Uncharacterized protein n=1 Tax=Salmo trutta TaxID=8032 RepID=A0A673WEN0_SALTR
VKFYWLVSYLATTGGCLKVSYIFQNGDRYEKSSYHIDTKVSAAGWVLCCEWTVLHLFHTEGRGTLEHPSGPMYEGDLKTTSCSNFPFTDSQGLVWTGGIHNKAAPGLKLKLNMEPMRASRVAQWSKLCQQRFWVRAQALSEPAATGRSMGRRTIGPASSGLGRV